MTISPDHISVETGIAGRIWTSIRNAFVGGGQISSEAHFRVLEPSDLRQWMTEKAPAIESGRCAGVYNSRRKTITLMFVHEDGSAVYDARGRRVAQLFKFDEVSSEISALFDDDDTVVFKL